jgi:hypothetical protein
LRWPSASAFDTRVAFRGEQRPHAPHLQCAPSPIRFCACTRACVQLEEEAAATGPKGAKRSGGQCRHGHSGPHSGCDHDHDRGSDHGERPYVPTACNHDHSAVRGVACWLALPWGVMVCGGRGCMPVWVWLRYGIDDGTVM